MKTRNLIGQLVIEELIRLGVDYFCLAPGSRSTPLTHAVALHQQKEDFVHYDERGLAFHALGYAKATQKPAAIIITSGSSLANVYPAIIEAHYSQVPLLILSGDRPFELHDCGSNQAIDQNKFFGSYVKWQANINAADAMLPIGSVLSTLDYAYYKTQKGPVHLNFQFREPFLQEDEVHDVKTYNDWKLLTRPYCEYTNPLSSNCILPDFKLSTKGILILGRDTSTHDIDEINALAHHLGFPIFADILAPKAIQKSPYYIQNYESILEHESSFDWDCVIQLGHTFTSKKLMQTLQKAKPKHYFLISDQATRSDPNHLPSKHLFITPASFAIELQKKPFQPDHNWTKKWQSKDLKITHFLDHWFENSNLLSEPSAARALFEVAPTSSLFYIASSRPIRDVISYAKPQADSEIFCNRGASGTDGNLATAFGLSQAKNKSIYVLIGDVALLYDLNSLGMISSLKHPPTIVVINNQGCGIFKFLPISSQTEVYQRYFHAEHPYQFEHAAGLFGLDYDQPQDLNSFKNALEKSSNQGKLIEVKTNSDQNYSLHKEIKQNLAHAIQNNSR